MIIGVNNIDVFKIFFDVIYEDAETIEFKCSPNDIRISLLDKSHVCFYEATFDNTFFDLFDVDGVESILLYTDDLVKILKTANKKDYLTLSSDESRVVAKFEREGNSRVFELVQSADFMDSPVPPTIDCPCEISVSFDSLIQSLKDLDIMKTGTIHMVCNGENLLISSETDASMKYQNSISGEITGAANAHYTINFIKKLLKFKGINNEITLKYGDDMPLSWTVAGDGITINGLIAPRMVEE